MVSGVIGDLYAKYNSERSFFGCTKHVLKSGIQKYGRRAEIEKGLWCLVEMDLFSMLEWEGNALDTYMKRHSELSRADVKVSAKRVRSNMINRLIAMISEEVSISAWWMPAKMKVLYQNWIENRGTPDSRKYLMDMYLNLVFQRMIRLISDLKSVYILPPYYVENKQMNDFRQIHCGIRSLYPAVYATQTNVGRVDWDLTGYPANLRLCIKGIIYNLETCSDHVFYWMSRLCDLEEADGTSKYRYIKLVWSVLYHFINRHREYEFVKDAISALEFFFKKMGHQEQPIYLYHALLLLIRRNEIDWGSRDPGIDTPFVEVEKLYRDHLAGGKMPMDDYILDHHTHGGKRGTDDLENFALEGAYIENENDTFLRREYREIYVLLKQELDRYRCKGRTASMISSELKMLSDQAGVPIQKLSAETIKLIEDAPQAQKRTATYKKAVYIIKALVFKGPYTSDKDFFRLMENLRYTFALQLLEEVLHLPEWQRGSLRWEFIGYWSKNQYYLVAQNVGSWKNISSRSTASGYDPNAMIVPREMHVMRVSEIEGTELLTDDIKMASLQHLYLRFLLGIGDSGTHNILVRKDYDTSNKLIAGIDLEDRRGEIVNPSRLSFLFGKLYNKHITLYRSDIHKIKSLSYSELGQRTLDKLRNVGIDLHRLKMNMELWDSMN